MDSFSDEDTKTCTLLQKIFRNHDMTSESSQLSSLLKSIHPNIVIDKTELNEIISQHDRDGSGHLDFDSIVRIAFHFLLKQGTITNDSSDGFIRINDFVISPEM